MTTTLLKLNPPIPSGSSPLHTEMSSIEIPLQPDVAALGLSKEYIVMHSSPTTGYNMGPAYNNWFTQMLGYEVVLLYIGDSRREVLGGMPPKAAARVRREQDGEDKRQSNGTSWLSTITSALPSIPILNGNAASSEEEYPGVDEGMAFPEVAPYLIISTKSWENVQARLVEGEEIDISKFRANVIVEGAEKEFEEDFWGELDVSADGFNQDSPKAKFVLTQNCVRCNSLNVDYRTGRVGVGEAGRILKKLQSDRRVDAGAKYSPIFGRHGFLDRLANSERWVDLKVGDEVQVGRWNEVRTTWGECVLFLFVDWMLILRCRLAQLWNTELGVYLHWDHSGQCRELVPSKRTSITRLKSSDIQGTDRLDYNGQCT